MHEFLKELFNSASGIKENGNIHEFFTFCLQVRCYEKLYCYGDLSFQKGCEQCYHNAVDDWNKGLILNSLLSSAMALVESPLVTKINGPVEYSNNGRQRD